MRPHIVVIDRIFDTDAACALLATLLDVAPCRPIVLDFTRARDVHDCALATIAEALARDGHAARYLGLLHHQERMLHYLGLQVDLGEAPEVGASP